VLLSDNNNADNQYEKEAYERKVKRH